MALGKTASWLFSHLMPKTFAARARQLPVSMENFIQNRAGSWPQGKHDINTAVQVLRQQVANHYAGNATLAGIPRERRAEIRHAVAQYCMARPTMPPLAEQTRIAAALNTVPPEQHIGTACVRQLPPERQAEIFEQVCTFFARTDAPSATPEAQARIAAACAKLVDRQLPIGIAGARLPRPDLHIDSACVQQIPQAQRVEIWEHICAFYAEQNAVQPTLEEQSNLALKLNRLPTTRSVGELQAYIQQNLREMCADYLPQSKRFTEDGIFDDMERDIWRGFISINEQAMPTSGVMPEEQAQALELFRTALTTHVPDLEKRKMISMLLCQCAREPLYRYSFSPHEQDMQPGIKVAQTILSTQGETYHITLRDHVTAISTIFDFRFLVQLNDVVTHISIPKHQHGADITVTCEVIPIGW